MKTISRSISALMLAALGALSLQAHAAGDVEKGKDVFSTECAECHSVREGKNKKGPSLFAVVGRKAATVADATYSDALKASGILWSPDKVDAYVTAPKKLVPGGKMKYDGLASAAERADLIAYLATLR
ncbi:MAG TPA: c-type cytochrome [Zoogloea sp.]|jgi:cytochrome c|uniref:c-type cytochrome n=1 Tax=Zoogloea sp. TaxID=49181 RepID=UPI002B5E3C2C|nr:c-type cytochrome [Zoogloea sp.]HOB46328.1 c-type cytochrome [Zoogloea sp.]HQA09879.1 c-type cytochrome [Zoogloea sp.]HQE39495.1 c-type cytochrome [Zoogloea sp.]